MHTHTQGSSQQQECDVSRAQLQQQQPQQPEEDTASWVSHHTVGALVPINCCSGMLPSSTGQKQVKTL